MAAAFMAARARARKRARAAADLDDLFEPELTRGHFRPPSLHWTETVQLYSDAEFRSSFRVSRDVFNVIFAEISTSEHMQHAPRRRGGLAPSRVLHVDEQLAVFLRRMGLRSSEMQITNREFGFSDWAIEHASRRVALSIIDKFGHLIAMPRSVAARAVAAERAYKAQLVAAAPLVAHIPAAGELAAGRARRAVLFKEVMGYNQP